MRELNTVVAGVDFSNASKSALIEADRIAMWEGGSLHIAHVIPFNEAELLTKISDFDEEVLSTVDRELKLFVGGVEMLYNHKDYHVLVGHPFLQMMRLIEDVGADLLVIGSHGAVKEHNYLGGVASKCIRRSPIPVLVVRKQHNTAFERIVVCMDFSETALKALDYAAEIAANEGAELHILNVQTDPWALYSFPITGANQSNVEGYLSAAKQSAEDELEKLAAMVLEDHPGANVSTTVMPAVGVTQGIVDFINSKKMDLAVAGTHGHSKLVKFFIGTTTERLVHKCPCSILTVGPD